MIPFSDDELNDAAEAVISKIRPTLALDGGDVRMLGVKNGKVYVQLVGACIGCASSDQTLKYGIERELKIEIHPDITVVNVPIGSEERWQEL